MSTPPRSAPCLNKTSKQSTDLRERERKREREREREREIKRERKGERECERKRKVGVKNVLII